MVEIVSSNLTGTTNYLEKYMIRYHDLNLTVLLIAFVLSLLASAAHSQTYHNIDAKSKTRLKTPLVYESLYASVRIPTLEAAFQYSASCGMMVQYGLDQIEAAKLNEETGASDQDMTYIKTIVNTYEQRSEDIWGDLPEGAFGDMEYLDARTEVMVEMMFLEEVQRRYVAHLCVMEFERFLLADLTTVTTPEAK